MQKNQPLPSQRPIDEEAPPKPPSRLKRIGTRVLSVILILIALAFAYVFLLLGEPDKDVASVSGKTDTEIITAPIQAVQIMGDGDLSSLAVSFGKPVLVAPSGASLVTATLYDTAFSGGYARCATMTYQLADGAQFTLRSIRPDAAVTLLGGERYTQKLGSQYALAGMDAQYLSGESGALFVARGEGACYALHCPAASLGHALDMLKLCRLMQPAP